MPGKYAVKISGLAEKQLHDIAGYIRFTLQAPSTATKMLDFLAEEIVSLDQFPNRVPLTEEEPWHSRGLHKLKVKNFLVYFWVDEETMEVQVASIPGSKRVFGAKSQVYGEICDDLSGSGNCASGACTISMDDYPSIGLLLCKSKNDLVAEYALKDMSKPMGVSAYKVTSSLPEELQRQLPSIEDIEKRIQRE